VLTLWGFIAPLVERLRQPSKSVVVARPPHHVKPSKAKISKATPMQARKPASKPVGKPLRSAAGRDVGALQPTLFQKTVSRPRPRASGATVALNSVIEASEHRIAHGTPSLKGRRKQTRPARVPMQARYDALVKEMLATYNVRVRKWRQSMSGVAWYIEYRDGTTVRLLEAPKPKSPMSLAIFLHEIGHHAIGLGIHKPRCLEEYLAWNYAVTTMRDRGFEVTDRVKKRMDRSLRYAVRKAVRRGLRVLPAELELYR